MFHLSFYFCNDRAVGSKIRLRLSTGKVQRRR